MFASLLIANRGEIACRIARTAKAMGIRTIAVYSQADLGALHTEIADDAVPIGGGEAAAGYLSEAAIIEAARSSGAEAVHPGYGFLAENPDFAAACAEAGLIFVGPPVEAIARMGAKDVARGLVAAAGVAVIPGHDQASQSESAFAKAAADIGYPVLIKPAMGGGGKGMRRVDSPESLAEAAAAARREARSAFGDDRLILEKLIPAARHIEVQIFADRHGKVIHLYERDCSLQRRHQKVVEEAPAPGMTAGLRARMTQAAITVARSVAYEGAGTVEFLVDAATPLSDESPFYFLEMNTRLQVEHPVTELLTGIDVVEWQFRVAAGEPLPRDQEEIPAEGHAVEARLYAEDPTSGFLPSIGKLLAFEPIEAEGVRIDTGLRAGDRITPYYDPLIAKVVAHGGSREAALDRLRAALSACLVAGPRTNQAFLLGLLDESAFRRAAIDTAWLESAADRIVAPLRRPEPSMLAAGARLLAAGMGRSASGGGQGGPWSADDAFQLGPPRRTSIEVVADGVPCVVELDWSHGSADGEREGGDPHALSRMWIGRGNGEVIVAGQGRQIRLGLVDHSLAGAAGHADTAIAAPMPGQVTRLAVAEGAEVEAGTTIMVIEAMKMEHVVRAPRAGRVADLAVAEGEQVDLGQTLAVIHPRDD